MANVRSSRAPVRRISTQAALHRLVQPLMRIERHPSRARSMPAKRRPSLGRSAAAKAPRKGRVGRCKPEAVRAATGHRPGAGQRGRRRRCWSDPGAGRTARTEMQARVRVRPGTAAATVSRRQGRQRPSVGSTRNLMRGRRPHGRAAVRAQRTNEPGPTRTPRESGGRARRPPRAPRAAPSGLAAEAAVDQHAPRCRQGQARGQPRNQSNDLELDLSRARPIPSMPPAVRGWPRARGQFRPARAGQGGEARDEGQIPGIIGARPRTAIRRPATGRQHRARKSPGLLRWPAAEPGTHVRGGRHGAAPDRPAGSGQPGATRGPSTVA